MNRGWRARFDRHLVEGLTVDERIARLEGTVFGVARVDSLEQRIEDTEDEIHRLRAAERRHQLPFYRRWFTKGSR